MSDKLSTKGACGAMKLTKLMAIAAVGLFAGSAATQAETLYITNSTTIGWQAMSPFDLNMYLPQFDSVAYGTLTSVHVSMTGTVQAAVTGENGDTNAGHSISADMSGWVSASAPTLSTPLSMTALLSNSSAAIPVGAHDEAYGVYDQSGLDFYNFGTNTVSNYDSQTALVSNGDNLSSWIGTGTWQLPVHGQGGWSIGGSSVADTRVDTFQGNAGVQVVYGYVIPEPSVLAIAGLGALGFFLRRRIRAYRGGKA